MSKSWATEWDIEQERTMFLYQNEVSAFYAEYYEDVALWLRSYVHGEFPGMNNRKTAKRRISFLYRALSARDLPFHLWSGMRELLNDAEQYLEIDAWQEIYHGEFEEIFDDETDAFVIDANGSSWRNSILTNRVPWRAYR